jgi:predicted DNA-binding transcriptional regulator AlpA
MGKKSAKRRRALTAATPTVPAEDAPIALDPQQTARYIGMSAIWLAKARYRGALVNGAPAPPYLQMGRSIRYLKSDLDSWLAARRVDRGTNNLQHVAAA